MEDHIRKGQRITGMTSGRASFPVAAPIFKFQQAGKSGTWMSELLPHTVKIALFRRPWGTFLISFPQKPFIFPYPSIAS